MDGNGVPLAVIVGGANRHDSIFLASLLDARVISQPNQMINNLCLDAGYTGKERDVRERDMVPHIRPRGEEKTFREKKRYSSRGDGLSKPRIPGSIVSAN